MRNSPGMGISDHVTNTIQGGCSMGISKRLALVLSGAAFAGTAALTLGAAAPAGAAVAAPASAPATGTHLTSIFGCGGCWGCWDDCDDWDDWGW